jgi:DNA-binding LytR/AlgR family response regulator
MAELDPGQFWQVHRGTVVNAREIAAVTTDEWAAATSSSGTIRTA